MSIFWIGPVLLMYLSVPSSPLSPSLPCLPNPMPEPVDQSSPRLLPGEPALGEAGHELRLIAPLSSPAQLESLRVLHR